MVWMVVACVVGGGEQSFTVVETVDAVHVELESGEVDVVSVEREGVLVDWEGGGISDDELFTADVIDGVLVISSTCSVACGGELYVEVPSGTDLCVRVGAGEARIALDADADVCVETGAGELSIEVPAGAWDIDLDIGAGEVSLFDVVDDGAAERSIQARLGAGELSVFGIVGGE